MFTTVPRTEVVAHRPRPGEPALEVIDHREQHPDRLNSKKKRPEQLPYGTLKTQRDNLFTNELKYKQRIEELEKTSAEVVKAYENTYEENTKLKRILDNGPDATKMKQLSKDRKEQKGIIDRLKDENQSLAEKLAELEKEVHTEKLKANVRSWDVQLAKVKKKRKEEDSIPTEGPFVGGQIVKSKKLSLIGDEGVNELDAYDLQVDSLEKETQVLLNKVKILRREKEQIDYATLMGKGAVTKNKTIAKAINDKLNRDLNKFVIRLQMLKMKQNAARTYCSLMTDESNPVIQLKPSDTKSGQATPDVSTRESRSGKSWKKPTPDALSPKAVNGNSKMKSYSNMSKKQEAGPKHGESSSRLSHAKGRESNTKKKPTPDTSRDNSVNDINVAVNKINPSKAKSSNQGSNSKQPSRKNSVEIDGQGGNNQSARVWERVQSSKLFGGSNVKDALQTKRSGDPQTVQFNNNVEKRNTKGLRPKTNAELIPKSKAEGINKPSTKAHKEVPGSSIDNNKPKQRNNKSGKQEAESTGRYTHGPEPVGRKGLNDKKGMANAKDDAPEKPKSDFTRKPRNFPKNGLVNGNQEDFTYHHHGHGQMYRINGPDDGFSTIRLHDQRLDRGVRAKPVPINFKSKKSYDVKENRSIIGNSGIRKDAFYRQLNDEEPYYGV